MTTPNPPLKNQLCLIIDAEPDSLAHLGELIEKSGMRTVRCLDSRKVSQILADYEIDLVVTESRMLPANGLEILRMARAQSPRLPVIVLFSKDRDSSLTESVLLELGADVVITKEEATSQLSGLARALCGHEFDEI